MGPQLFCRHKHKNTEPGDWACDKFNSGNVYKFCCAFGSFHKPGSANAIDFCIAIFVGQHGLAGIGWCNFRVSWRRDGLAWNSCRVEPKRFK